MAAPRLSYASAALGLRADGARALSLACRGQPLGGGRARKRAPAKEPAGACVWRASCAAANLLRANGSRRGYDFIWPRRRRLKALRAAGRSVCLSLWRARNERPAGAACWAWPRAKVARTCWRPRAHTKAGWRIARAPATPPRARALRPKQLARRTASRARPIQPN